jgi:16S rRNA (cytosine967-C5)-methyltransferase
MKKSSPYRTVPRKAALAVLTDVLSNERPLDDAIESRAQALSPSDRAWLTDTTSGVLRNLRRLDLAIDAYALKKKPTGKLRKMLQIGAYQLIHQDRVFPATVVSETVDFARQEEGEATAKFANALLRRIAESSAEWKALPPPDAKAPVDHKASWASLPDWWWKRWERDLGFERAARISEKASERPELWFRFARGKQPDLNSFSLGPVPGSARTKDSLASGDVKALPGFREGEWIVQDLASQVLVERFAETLSAERGPDATLLDRCAAPGGKAIAMAWKGFTVSATDSDRARLAIVEENIKRTGVSIEVLPETDGIWNKTYDAIWIDAPCSGSGILRRHPDVRWIRREKDVEGLQKIQRSLIEEAFEKLPSGGLLFFSVCSLFRDEGRAHFDALGWTQPGSPAADLLWEVTLTPDAEPSTDGFYGAALRKK